MSRDKELERMLDEWAMKRLAYNYARGGDRNEREIAILRPWIVRV